MINIHRLIYHLYTTSKIYREYIPSYDGAGVNDRKKSPVFPKTADFFL